jgi:hypothetical protein
MIKRYNQFVNKKVNENKNEEPNLSNDEFVEIEKEEVEEYFEEEEEEAGDFYNNKLKELANLLGVEVVDGKVEFEGKEIIFPSETDMYHYDKKKFKTAQEVFDFIMSKKGK